jgi:glycosyltransferase involved in cell wall biosynthesis
MRIALLCCWSNMRIYPIYSSSLRIAIEALTGNKVAVITTNCYCFDPSNPVNQDYDFISLPYPFTKQISNSSIKNYTKLKLYDILENRRGRLFAARSGDFDIVDFQQSSYAFGYESLKSFLSKSSRAKKIVTIHKLDAIQKDKPQLNLVYNRADGIITFSTYVKEMLIADGVDSSKIAVVYHGTSLEPLQDRVKDQAILFCGSPIPHIKGFEHLVVALGILREQGVALRIKVYGFFSPPEREYARRLAAENGVEGWLDWQSFSNERELIDEHQKSLFCLIPYTGYAGYFPAAYAMGNGVAVIATDILGHAEYVDGAGLLIAPGSPEELVVAIKRLLDDEVLRRELGENGRRRAEEALGWETVASQTLRVFENVMAGRPL